MSNENQSKEIPRRIRLDLMHPVEKMITETKWELEKIGVDIRLTDATILLSKAKDLISDFIDGVTTSPTPSPQEIKSKEAVLRSVGIYKESKEFRTFGNILTAMEAYASQFKPSHKEGGQEERMFTIVEVIGILNDFSHSIRPIRKDYFKEKFNINLSWEG